MAQSNDEQLASFEAIDINEQCCVPTEMAGWRVDKAAAQVFSDYSREQLKQWLHGGELRADGASIKPKTRLKGGEMLTLNATLYEHGEDKPENIPLHVVYEDDVLLVINKPVGLVVHPGAGNWTGTLVNGLLYHDAQLAALPRAGLVHRIDKDTSGLLVVAKTLQAQQALSSQLKDKSVYRHYQAVVLGVPKALGTVDAPIGRHPNERTKMAVVAQGKPAISHFKLEREMDGASLVSVTLETGRTHQIRVHMAYIGHPLVGDKVYGGLQRGKGMSDATYAKIANFERQALHAYRLGFMHPTTGDDVQFEADLPVDMQALLADLSA